MCFGGDTPEVENDDAMKAQAETFARTYEYMEREFNPIRDQFLADLQTGNAAVEFDQLNKMVDTNVAMVNADTMQQNATAMQQSGIDPSSGRYQQNQQKLGFSLADGHSSVRSTAQNEQQDRHVGNLMDATAIGEGQAIDAVTGIADVARDSFGRQVTAAGNKLKSNQENKSLGFTLAGAGTRAFGSNFNDTSGSNFSFTGSNFDENSGERYA